MADTNAYMLEKMTSMGIAKRDVNGSGSDINEGEKKTSFTVSDDLKPDRPVDVESIGSEQPTGLKRMEAITQVWTKKWLIAAYVLYVSSRA
jgi:hypothetical protein